MSPTVLRIGGYRFFFNSREETRRHIHVATVEGTAKFWFGGGGTGRFLPPE